MLTTVLPLQSEHIDGCARLMAGLPLWHEHYAVNEEGARARFAAGLAEGADIRVALAGDEVVGFVFFLRRGVFGRSGYIRLLGVRADWQAQGVGTQLMDVAEAACFAEARDVFLFVSAFNEAAQRFYRHRGYGQVGVITDYVQPGVDELIFRKRRPE